MSPTDELTSEKWRATNELAQRTGIAPIEPGKVRDCSNQPNWPPLVVLENTVVAGRTRLAAANAKRLRTVKVLDLFDLWPEGRQLWIQTVGKFLMEVPEDVRRKHGIP